MIAVGSYKALKAFLKGFTVFLDNGQLRGQKTLYKSQCVLIEPKKTGGKIKHFKHTMADRNYTVKVTAVSPAPWADHDNTVQDSQLTAHTNYAADVLIKLVDQEVKDDKGRLVLSALTLTDFNGPNFTAGHAITEMIFTCEAFDYSLVPSKIKVQPVVEVSKENA